MKSFWFLVLCLLPIALIGQDFNRKDSLRGSITKERAWWDLLHYNIDVTVDIDHKSLSGSNTIKYRVIDNSSELHIDLQEPMKIKSIRQEGKFLVYKKEFSAYFIKLIKPTFKILYKSSQF